MALICCFLGGVVTAASTFGCIWIRGTTLEGAFGDVAGQEPTERFFSALEKASRSPIDQHMLKVGGATAELIQEVIETQPVKAMKWLADAPNRYYPPNWPAGLDNAVYKILGGDAPSALNDLKGLARKDPDNYYILSNLAVAFELTGDDVKALQTIDKALEIYPLAHNETEWIHGAVLKAKLALKSDPAWLATHSICGLPSRPAKDFSLQAQGRVFNATDLHAAITAHAFTRCLLVKPKDAVTGALLRDLAILEARVYSVEKGLEVLGLAERYGADVTDVKTAWASAISAAKRHTFMTRIGIDPLWTWREGLFAIVSIGLAIVALMGGLKLFCRLIRLAFQR